MTPTDALFLTPSWTRDDIAYVRDMCNELKIDPAEFFAIPTIESWLNPAYCVPKDDGKVEKLQKEVSDLRLSLARTEIVTKLAKAKEAGASVDPNDEQLVSDLLIMPPDVQDRTFSRFPKRAGAGDRTGVSGNLS